MTRRIALALLALLALAMTAQLAGCRAKPTDTRHSQPSMNADQSPRDDPRPGQP